MQAWKPELISQALLSKASTMHTYNTSPESWKQEDPWGLLTNQPSQLINSRLIEIPCLKNKSWRARIRHNVYFYPTHGHIHTCTHSHMNAHTYMSTHRKYNTVGFPIKYYIKNMDTLKKIDADICSWCWHSSQHMSACSALWWLEYLLVHHPSTSVFILI